MNYKDMLEEGEKVLNVSKIHAFVMTFPVVFVTIFGAIFIVGGMLTGEFLVICYIMTAVLAFYPIVILLLLINSRYVITDKRVIEQTGVFSKRARAVDIKEIVKVSFYQTTLGKSLKCGDVMIQLKSANNETYYRIFKFITNPHEFILTLHEVMGVR